ncbi:MAG: phage repressor protein CI [Pantoea sp.]|uniref:phage repressor protein CI n=1 Tax=Pantoea sp. TaxID=69393 RepID=UPI0023A52CEA|nr:phage repressor protein CI [Pantoea sp.]MDE1190120.1 phage repressor protein CI [Pantoea sp.]
MSNDKITKRHDSSSIRESVESHKGGKDVIFRIVEAYGFSSRQALCNHLGVSQSTLANRSARDTFPADWVIICHVETGASLFWLTTGQGHAFETATESHSMCIAHKKITNGMLNDVDDFVIDKTALPEGLQSPLMVSTERSIYLTDRYDGEILDGMWLIEIDGLVSIRELIRFPGGRVRVENGKTYFECQVEDIKVLGKVVSRTEFL